MNFLNGKLSLGKREIWIVVALVGIFLLLICNLLEGNQNAAWSQNNLLYDTVGQDASMSYKEDSSYDIFGITQSSEGEEIAGFCTLWETKIESVLSGMQGVGKTDVIMYAQPDDRNLPNITGVLVLAQGAGDVTVEVRIKNVLKTLLGISEMQIAVQTLSQTDIQDVQMK